MTLIQSRSFVYRFFNLLIKSFVIKLAILVSKAILLDIIIPAPGLIKLIVELPTVEALPTRILVIINKIFFSGTYIYFYNFHYQF